MSQRRPDRTASLGAATCFGCSVVASQFASTGFWPWLVAAAGAATVAWLGRDRRAPAMPLGAESDLSGTNLMVSTVVPVWQRQIEASMKATDDGISDLLGSVSKLSDGLNQAAQPIEGIAGARGPQADELLEAHGEAIDALLEPMQQALRERQQMLDEVHAVDQHLVELQQLAKEVRQIAAQTNLVALNASIEANRASRDGAGFTVVAQEVRRLANQSDSTGVRIAGRVNAMAARVGQTREAALLRSRSDTAVRLQARLQARQAIGLVSADLSKSLGAARKMQAVSTRLSADLDRVLEGFQFQDRTTQMLNSIRDDMQRFTRWVSEHDEASAADAARWLDELNRTYTMEEQRTHHHGSVAIERGASIDFF